MPKLKGPAAGRAPDDRTKPIPPTQNVGRSKGASIIGLGLFALLLIWGLWHAVIGPRIIDPMPGDPTVELPPPDPDRAPPR